VEVISSGPGEAFLEHESMTERIPDLVIGWFYGRLRAVGFAKLKSDFSALVLCGRKEESKFELAEISAYFCARSSLMVAGVR